MAIIAYTIAPMRSCRFITALVLALFCLATAYGQSPNDRAQQARAELEQLQDRIQQVKNAISEGRDRHDALADKLNAAGQAVRRQSRQLHALIKDINALESSVAKLRHKRNQEKAQLGNELAALRAQVQAAYRNGQPSKLRLLLSGQAPARVGRMLVYYEYFTRAQSQQVARLRDHLAELARRQSALEAKQAQLAERQAKRAATLADLKHSRAQRKATLAALEKRLASRQSTLADYRATAQHLKDLLGSLSQKLTPPSAMDPGTFTALKGQMQPPAQGPILAHFGDPKANGLMHWQGQWRGAEKGSAIRAVADGRVVYVGYMHHYGLIVVLEHAGDYFTVYGHALSSYVAIGDYVSRNEAIARVGSSGGHHRSGVYFEIRKGEQALDPSLWLHG